MNYTKWLIPRLKNLEAQRRAIANIPERIKTLELQFSAIRAASTDGDPVSGGTNRREDALLANIAEREELQNNYSITCREIQEIDNALAALTKEERIVIENFYINRCKNYIDRLCSELRCERTTVYRIKDEATVKLARSLWGQVRL